MSDAFSNMWRKFVGQTFESCEVLRVSARGAVVERPDGHTAFVPNRHFGGTTPRVGDFVRVRILSVRVNDLKKRFEQGQPFMSCLAEILPAKETKPAKPAHVPGMPPKARKTRRRSRKKNEKSEETKVEETFVWPDVTAMIEESALSDRVSESDEDDDHEIGAWRPNPDARAFVPAHLRSEFQAIESTPGFLVGEMWVSAQ